MFVRRFPGGRWRKAYSECGRPTSCLLHHHLPASMCAIFYIPFHLLHPSPSSSRFQIKVITMPDFDLHANCPSVRHEFRRVKSIRENSESPLRFLGRAIIQLAVKFDYQLRDTCRCLVPGGPVFPNYGTGPFFYASFSTPRTVLFPMRTFRSLRHRNYRLYFAGQMTSLIGSWTQITALTWLAHEYTHKPRARISCRRTNRPDAHPWALGRCPCRPRVQAKPDHPHPVRISLLCLDPPRALRGRAFE